jgi:uncharacterized membrane protein
MSNFTDTGQPQPVRISAFAGLLAKAILVVLGLALPMSSDLLAALVGVVAVLELAGWLWVRTQVTPVASPRGQTGQPLVPARTGDLP